MTSVKLEEGQFLARRFSYSIPDTFVCVEQIYIERKWWKFWLPNTACAYTVIVTKEEKL